ncbi:hypothetical protein [Streptomyces hundungensis]|uniref:hypothetical protein n=1 Tax=Streptomyces hundungensis TaxID=1077946 RepID=UPI0031E86865
MTDHQAQYGDANDLDRWLTQQQSHLLEALGDVLDVESGLYEVLLQSRHDTMADRLDGVLDVEAGLAAVLPGSDPAPESPEPVVVLPYEAATRELLPRPRVSPQVRITLRQRPDVVAGCEALEALEAVAAEWQTIQRRVAEVDSAVGCLPTPGGFEALESCSAHLIRTVQELSTVLEELKGFLRHGFDESLETVLENMELAGRELCALSNEAHGMTRPRHGRFTSRRADHPAAGYIDDVVDRVRRLGDELCHLVRRGGWAVGYLSIEGAERMSKILAKSAGVPGFPVFELRDVWEFLNNFTAADLRTAFLEGVDLAGVQWSPATTLWPEAVDVEDLKARSEETPAGSGIFIVRSGTATIRESVDA